MVMVILKSIGVLFAKSVGALVALIVAIGATATLWNQNVAPIVGKKSS